MIVRALLLSVAIVGTGLYGTRLAGRETPPERRALALLPRTLDGWTAPIDTPLAKESVAVLGVDDYVSRTYVNATTGQPVSLYIGYYGSQRQGDTIHSPQNCLPGAGWQPVDGGVRSIDASGRALTVNRYIIEKGIDRQVVLYWYQGRGRVVANEYANKFWLMVDAARLHRTNGALVRVMSPVPRSVGTGAAEGAALDFTRTVFPHLAAHLP